MNDGRLNLAERPVRGPLRPSVPASLAEQVLCVTAERVGRRLETVEVALGEAEVVRQKVSAAFIKELMRRAAQFRLERGGEGELTAADVENALDEILFRGGSLNRKLLGSA